MLQSFYGVSSKNPYKHIDEFLEVCSTFKLPNVSEDAIRLRLFPFSLKDKAKHWLTTRDNIATWDQMSKEFLKKCFLAESRSYETIVRFTYTQSIAKLETQVGQLANTIARRDEGKLPSFQMENPRGQTYPEETKAVTTLRSGKTIDNKVGLDNKEANEEKECLREKSQTDKVFLNEQVSSVLQYNTPPMLNDLGVPTITCLGDKRIDRALLDLEFRKNMVHGENFDLWTSRKSFLQLSRKFLEVRAMKLDKANVKQLQTNGGGTTGY
ncbi:uncharacterized protein G2W53_017991 [Senna tora]|uniref:Retrotransposon gag domain-containing protein n=1 Tax=Senna tora TaxID=362788 RepID=A0A834TSY0_9FABA|nr:uncharacterized protein G2W53_017991 [Senna tora]